MTHPHHAGRPPGRWAGPPDLVAVPLSAYAVRFHVPHPDAQHRAWCGVRANRTPYRDLIWAGELEPCGMCWPDTEPDLTPWDRMLRQCRYWDAVGAWEGGGIMWETGRTA